jgi:very-short-patch-repair endonuclease
LKNISQNDSWCPFCCIPQQKRCCDNKCIHCFNNSFASHPKAKLWHPTKNGKIKPRDIALNSNSYYWMLCDIKTCKHSYETYINRDNGCPYCAHQKMCDIKLKCKICLSKSFSIHPMSKLWDFEKNLLTPEEVFLNSNKKFSFICDKKDCGKHFSIRLGDANRGYGCSYCKKKTENKLHDFFTDYYKCMIDNKKILIIREKRFKWCKNILTLPFDFYIKKLKLIIELDGRQHIDKVYYNKTPEIIQKNDVFKMRKALNNNITIIRISQEDVWKDNINWKQELIKYMKSYKYPTVIYISKKKNLYDNHKLLLNKELTKQELKSVLKKILIKNITNYL